MAQAPPPHGEADPLLLRRLGRTGTSAGEAGGREADPEAGRGVATGGRAHLSSSSSSDEFFDCDDTLPGGGKSR